MRQIKINRYLLLSKKNNKDEAPVYLRVLLNGAQVQFSTGIFLKQEFWDQKKKEVKAKHPDAFKLNLKIEEEKKKILDIHYNLERSGGCDIKKIKDRYTGKGEKREKNVTILELIDYHNTLVKNALTNSTYSLSTYQGYQTLKAKLTKFISSVYHKSDFDLADLDLGFITKFEYFLASHFKNSPNTIAKQIDRLRRVIHVGLKNDWLKLDPFKNYEKKTTPTNRQYLTFSEVQSLRSLDLTGEEHLERARDIFLFSCYTGLSYSDYANLKEEYIVPSIDGPRFIHIARKKTFESCIIPVVPEAEEILAKHINHPICVYKGRSLPVVDNTRMNEYLKIIGKRAKITKPITCHIGRHTFATIALENGVPIETVSKILGHTSIKTTQIYGKITMQKIVQDFAVLLMSGFSHKKKAI